MSERFPASGIDAVVSITRAVTRHRIGLRLVFDEPLDADRLARAVRLSLDAEPILGCSFQADSFRAYWRRIEDLDTVEAFSAIETEHADQEVITFQALEVDDAGPQVAACLFRSPCKDVLGIKLSHISGDGQAAKSYAYLLSEIYTRLGTNPSWRPEPNATARPTPKDVWNALDPGQRRQARRAKYWTAPNWLIPAKARTGEGLTYRFLTLAPERFDALKACGRESEASINDMLLTGFFRACVRAFDPDHGKPLSLMCTADLRRYLPDVARLPIANVSLFGSLGIERVGGEDFGDTLHRVRERMNAWAQTCYGAGPALSVERIGSLGYKPMRRVLETALRIVGGSGRTYPWFTNMGILDEGRLGFDDRTPSAANIYGPAAFGASVVPTISTYRKALTVCMGSCDEDFDPELVRLVLHFTEEELDSVSG